MAIGINLGDDYDNDDSSMFGAKMGSWWVSSESDPRWNKSGRGYGLVSTGGPGEMGDWIREATEKFGPPPSDATMGFMKD